MQIFYSTLAQMGVLFIFIIVGFIVAKLKVVPENSGTVLSKLENNVFTPASILGTFIAQFTVEKLSGSWQLVLAGTVVVLIGIPIAILVSRFVT